MSSKERSYKTSFNDAGQDQYAELAQFVHAYMAVRGTRGQARDSAARELGLALAQYGQAFVCGEWAWSWSRIDDSIVRQKMMAFRGLHHPSKGGRHETSDRR